MSKRIKGEKALPAIGGFFEMETESGRNDLHSGAMALSTGRACLALIVEQLNPQKVYVPFYCCDALYEALNGRCGIHIYSVDNEFEIVKQPSLSNNEYILYINYFGVKNQYLEQLKIDYGDRLIIDDTHSFFRQGHSNHWSFCSARKYFGVPDGAYLYHPMEFSCHLPRNISISIDHLENRLAGNIQLAYRQFLHYESSLNSEIQIISKYSENKMSQIDMAAVRSKRKANFQFYCDFLGDLNVWQFEIGDYDPFCYPMICRHPVDKGLFHSENIFIPMLWPDLLSRASKSHQPEVRLTNCLLPLPIDHRYTPRQLERVALRTRELLEQR